MPYRAERTVTIDGRSYSGPVMSAPGHQRHDQDLFGMREVFLLDTAAATGFLVLPSVKTYVEFPFPPLMAELDAEDLLNDPVGHENVAGLGATKYRVDHKAADGSRAKGFLVARPRRHPGQARRRGDARPWRQADAVAMELSDVVTGPVDPALFALPQGLVRLPADALGPLLGGKPPS